jgi:integrase
MSADAIADVVSTHARQLGWQLALHDLRRTFAKLARSGQVPLEQIQLALGHQSDPDYPALSWLPARPG